jgi:hypothetical protein
MTKNNKNNKSNNNENLKIIAHLVKMWYNEIYNFSKNNLIIAKTNMAYKMKYGDLYKKLYDFIKNFNHASLIVTLANRDVEWVNKDELHYADFFKKRVDKKMNFGELMEYTRMKNKIKDLQCEFDSIIKYEIDFSKTSLLKNNVKINSKLTSLN